ncbi:uncharacterized protein [Henckelia pumila]|uniref:uncharacterized protein n=1 Tax=Henckelia pumila TaxID=405737 RepID=UPI003C6E4418
MGLTSFAPLLTNNFELKPSTIQLIQLQARLVSTSVENPYALERFMSICDTFKVNGVTSDAARLRLFPFSLQGEATKWLDDIPTGSITTWTELIQIFLNKYFPPTKMAKLFLDIISFKQKEGESLHTTWTRVAGCEEGKEGWSSRSRCFDGPECEDRRSETSSGTHESSVSESRARESARRQQLFEVEAANFVGNQGRQLYNSYNNYNQNWKHKQEDKKPSFEEIMMKYVSGTETRLQNQESMLQKLEIQMSQIATQLSTRPAGALPSNTEPNPRCVNAIMVVTRPQSEEKQMDKEKMMEEPKSSESKEDMCAENSSKADALAQMPNYARFLKDLSRNKKKLNDLTQVTLNEECSTVLKKKLPPKSQDPGRFSISCQIGSLSFANVLCDLGSNINLMPRVLAKKLGRPFLAASRALVDVEKGELVLRLNNEQFVFNMLKSATESPTLKSCFVVYLVDVIHAIGDECQQEKSSELLVLKQGSMSIDEYQQKFFDLLPYCPQISDNTEAKYNLFLQGLNPEIHDRVAVGE